MSAHGDVLLFRGNGAVSERADRPGQALKLLTVLEVTPACAFASICAQLLFGFVEFAIGSVLASHIGERFVAD
jgi:hypothetical protein